MGPETADGILTYTFLSFSCHRVGQEASEERGVCRSLFVAWDRATFHRPVIDTDAAGERCNEQ